MQVGPPYGVPPIQPSSIVLSRRDAMSLWRLVREHGQVEPDEATIELARMMSDLLERLLKPTLRAGDRVVMRNEPERCGTVVAVYADPPPDWMVLVDSDDAGPDHWPLSDLLKLEAE